MSISRIFLFLVPEYSVVVSSCAELCSQSTSMLTTFPSQTFLEQKAYHQMWLPWSACGCHGLHVHTGHFGRGAQQLKRGDRICHVCCSCSAETDHHFLSDCPVYSYIHDKASALFQILPPTVADFLNIADPALSGRFSGNVSFVGTLSCLTSHLTWHPVCC